MKRWESLQSILQKEPANRKAKLAMAQIYGYHSNFQKSDALYREVLAARPGDEPAELGLVHNLVVEGKTFSGERRIADSHSAQSHQPGPAAI